MLKDLVFDKFPDELQNAEKWMFHVMATFDAYTGQYQTANGKFTYNLLGLYYLGANSNVGIEFTHGIDEDWKDFTVASFFVNGDYSQSEKAFLTYQEGTDLYHDRTLFMQASGKLHSALLESVKDHAILKDLVGGGSVHHVRSP